MSDLGQIITIMTAAAEDLRRDNDAADELDTLRYERIWIEAHIDNAEVDGAYLRFPECTELSERVRRLSQDWIRVASHILRLEKREELRGIGK